MCENFTVLSKKKSHFVMVAAICLAVVGSSSLASAQIKADVETKPTNEKSIDIKPIKFSFPKLNLHLPAIHLHLPKMRFKEHGKDIHIGQLDIDVPKLDVNMKDVHVNIPAIHLKAPSVKVESEPARQSG